MFYFVLTRVNASGKFYAWRDCAKQTENIIKKFLSAGDVVSIECCNSDEEALKKAGEKNKEFKQKSIYIYD